MYSRKHILDRKRLKKYKKEDVPALITPSEKRRKKERKRKGKKKNQFAFS